MIESLYQQIDDTERRVRESTERLDAARNVSALLADVVGTAQSEDGHVRVEYGAAGVRELTIDPRALKMVSEDLAGAIKKALADAVVDFRARTMEAMREADLVPDPEEQRQRLEAARTQLAEAQNAFGESLRSAADRIAEAQRMRVGS